MKKAAPRRCVAITHARTADGRLRILAGAWGRSGFIARGGGAQALLTRNVKDAPGREVKHVEHLFRDFYWGHSAVKKVEGFGNAARETTWQYIEKGAARGKVMERAAPEGGVVRCACDAPEGVGLMKRARAPAGRRRRLTRPLILRNLFY